MQRRQSLEIAVNVFTCDRFANQTFLCDALIAHRRGYYILQVTLFRGGIVKVVGLSRVRKHRLTWIKTNGKKLFACPRVSERSKSVLLV